MHFDSPKHCCYSDCLDFHAIDFLLLFVLINARIAISLSLWRVTELAGLEAVGDLAGTDQRRLDPLFSVEIRLNPVSSATYYSSAHSLGHTSSKIRSGEIKLSRGRRAYIFWA
jgi:hypothetical protein